MGVGPTLRDLGSCRWGVRNKPPDHHDGVQQTVTSSSPSSKRPQLKKLYAPFWTYDCVGFLLCPRFKNGGQCRSMADPYQITRGAVGLGDGGQGSPLV